MQSAPILSTPDAYLLDATEPVADTAQAPGASRSDEELSIIYDVDRTLTEIRQGRWRRIALQFPDDMLPDAPRVFQLLARGVQTTDRHVKGGNNGAPVDEGLLEKDTTSDIADKMTQLNLKRDAGDQPSPAEPPTRLYILADTSYGNCCVDEVAAEHVNADVVVHYGRACLSPTSRLPVIHVFTHRSLPMDPLVRAFKETFTDSTSKIILAADVTYSDHVAAVHGRLVEEGYTNLFATQVVHDPSSAIPNRTVPDSVKEQPDSLGEWQLFHIAEPPTALLLTLSSRVSAIYIYSAAEAGSGKDVKPLQASTAAALRRRYGTLVSLSTASVFGILINTLSVKNYLHIVDHVKRQIAAAGKKSYMFVVGKLNAAKVANFSEIDGWVVIGCWESSLVDTKDFWKPIITPYELELALQSDDTRVWTGAWRGDYQAILDASPAPPDNNNNNNNNNQGSDEPTLNDNEDDTSDFESAPPEFNLRTGQLITNSRPMQHRANGASQRALSNGTALAKRVKGDVAAIGSTVSPGAEYLRSQRTWQGLGSDFEIKYEEDGEPGGAAVVEGRKGIARGYTVGSSTDRH